MFKKHAALKYIGYYSLEQFISWNWTN